jgi:phosphatidylinositol alpha-1,6-mannosyltransferase
VRFTGVVTDSILSALYERCLVCVALYQHTSTDFEGFGITLVEAAAHRKPVLAGRGGGVVDAVVHEKTGLLVDATNPTETRDALLTLLESSELREQMGRQGRLRVEESFSIANLGRILLAQLGSRGLISIAALADVSEDD